MRKWVAIIAILLVGLCSMPSVVVSSELDRQRLLKIQVAYLLNFAKFIEWPTTGDVDPESPFVIGVYGTDPFGGLLEGLEEKTVHGQVVETRSVTDLNGADGCHIVFVGGLDGQQELLILLDYLHGKPVVTVSTFPKFVELGGIIELQQQGEYVLFLVNLAMAEKSGLVIPAQVLALAVEVVRGGQ